MLAEAADGDSFHRTRVSRDLGDRLLLEFVDLERHDEIVGKADPRLWRGTLDKARGRCRGCGCCARCRRRSASRRPLTLTRWLLARTPPSSSDNAPPRRTCAGRVAARARGARLHPARPPVCRRPRQPGPLGGEPQGGGRRERRRGERRVPHRSLQVPRRTCGRAASPSLCCAFPTSLLRLAAATAIPGR
jgi:hypothetical protein